MVAQWSWGAGGPEFNSLLSPVNFCFSLQSPHRRTPKPRPEPKSPDQTPPPPPNLYSKCGGRTRSLGVLRCGPWNIRLQKFYLFKSIMLLEICNEIRLSKKGFLVSHKYL
jgi:hypothetical protein